jgi:hypothetical protein
MVMSSDVRLWVFNFQTVQTILTAGLYLYFIQKRGASKYATQLDSAASGQEKANEAIDEVLKMKNLSGCRLSLVNSLTGRVAVIFRRMGAF